MQTRDGVQGLHNCGEFSNSLKGLDEAMETRKKSSIAFIKYCSLIIRQMKENAFLLTSGLKQTFLIHPHISYHAANQTHV